MLPRDMLLATLVALLWGGNMVAIKLATNALPPLFVLVVRFTLVAALLLPFRLRPGRHRLLPLLAVALTLGTCHFGLIFLGVARTDAATAAIAGQLGVPFSALLAVLIFRERFGGAQLAGLLLAFLGVIALAGTPRLAGNLGGLAIILAAAFAWACANVLIKRLGPFEPLTLVAWVALLAIPPLALLSWSTEQGQWQALMRADATTWLAVLYTALGSSTLAYGLWYGLLARNEVSRLVPFALLNPVFAVAAAWLLLGEPLEPLLIAGGVLILAGVALVEGLGRRRSVRPADDAAGTRGSPR